MTKTFSATFPPIKEASLAVFAWFGDLVNLPASIQIERDEKEHLVLVASYRRIEIDKAKGSISVNGRRMASFAVIESIEIRHCRGDKRLEWWTVSLNLPSQTSIRIGRSFNDLEASTAAASLSAILGKRVVALS